MLEAGRQHGLFGEVCQDPWTAFAAVRITSVTRAGLESMMTWLLAAVVTVGGA
jgi:hypothetical protein